ncbi:unnamed protein product [Adineta steineri]|uniref:Cystatin domain-containing protein n=1 Tax=Adineta steineri TaxID=433720 RepID=A0A814KE54_9BILA|nr:unnamed protein product [Adineta steineri]CAF1082448.1 unnamed protein product [Adineta steineri]
MLLRLFILILGIGIVRFGDTCTKRKLGGWQSSNDDTLQTEMVTLAQQQLEATSDLSSQPIRVLSFQTQVVAGTNLRLLFIVNEQQQCTLQAFKPLPYTELPTQITSFQCNNVTEQA